MAASLPMKNILDLSQDSMKSHEKLMNDLSDISSKVKINFEFTQGPIGSIGVLVNMLIGRSCQPRSRNEVCTY